MRADRAGSLFAGEPLASAQLRSPQLGPSWLPPRPHLRPACRRPPSRPAPAWRAASAPRRAPWPAPCAPFPRTPWPPAGGGVVATRCGRPGSVQQQLSMVAPTPPAHTARACASIVASMQSKSAQPHAATATAPNLAAPIHAPGRTLASAMVASTARSRSFAAAASFWALAASSPSFARSASTCGVRQSGAEHERRRTCSQSRQGAAFSCLADQAVRQPLSAQDREPTGPGTSSCAHLCRLCACLCQFAVEECVLDGAPLAVERLGKRTSAHMLFAG